MGTLDTTRRMAASLRSHLTAAGRREAIRARLGRLPEGGFGAGPAGIPRQAGPADEPAARPAAEADPVEPANRDRPDHQRR